MLFIVFGFLGEAGPRLMQVLLFKSPILILQEFTVQEHDTVLAYFRVHVIIIFIIITNLFFFYIN